MSEQIKIRINRWSTEHAKLITRWYVMPYDHKDDDGAKIKMKKLEQEIINQGGIMK